MNWQPGCFAIVDERGNELGVADQAIRMVCNRYRCQPFELMHLERVWLDGYTICQSRRVSP